MQEYLILDSESMPVLTQLSLSAVRETFENIHHNRFAIIATKMTCLDLDGIL